MKKGKVIKKKIRIEKEKGVKLIELKIMRKK